LRGCAAFQRYFQRFWTFLLVKTSPIGLKGFTHGLVVRFADRAGLESYGPSEAHQRVVKNLISPIRADVLALDYEL
jgi:hypothetical protein